MGLVTVRDTDARQVLTQGGLGESAATGGSDLANVEERRDPEGSEGGEEILDAGRFVADGDQPLELHERYLGRHWGWA